MTKETVTIRIDAPVGRGKTSISQAIAELLISYGIEVENLDEDVVNDSTPNDFEKCLTSLSEHVKIKIETVQLQRAR